MAALSKLGNTGVPSPVTGSQPSVHCQPYLYVCPPRPCLLFPAVTSVKAVGLA